MGLIIIALAMAVMIGALAWLRPTPRTRRINALHTDAFAQGLKLRHEFLPDMSIDGRVSDSKSSFTFFNRELKEKQAWPTYTVLRTTGEASMYLPDGWYMHQQKNMDREQLEQLAELLSVLPDTVTAVTQWPLGLGLAIDERVELEAKQICGWLEQMYWPNTTR